MVRVGPPLPPERGSLHRPRVHRPHLLGRSGRVAARRPALDPACGALLAALGCSDGAARATVAPLATVRIEPDAPALIVGQGTQLTARTLPDLMRLDEAAVRWRVLPDSLASVSASGRLSARAPGRGVIEARDSAGGAVLGTASLAVAERGACILAVVPAARAATLRPGEVRALGWRITTCDPGLAVDSTVLASVADTAVASVDAAGRVTARAVGVTSLVLRAAGSPRAAAAVHLAVVCSTPVRASLVVDPPMSGVVIGDSLRLRATLRVDSPTCLPDAVTRAVRYATADSGLVSLGDAGVARRRRAGVAPGEVTSVLFPNLVTTASVVVREPDVRGAP